MTAFVTLGYAEPEERSKTRQRMLDFADRLGALVNIDVAVAALPSYDRVAQLVHHGEIDLAWLPPIPLIALARNRRVVPLVSHHRDQLLHFRSAIIVAAGSRIASLAGLRGKRAAWVDAQSASGFVLPRIELHARGVDLTRLGAQRFFGSHDAVVRAVASGRADFAGTFARISRKNEVMGAWSRAPGLAASIRVLATFGEVPPDALAARFAMERPLREAIVRALIGMTTRSTDRRLLGDVFGADDLFVPRRAQYEPLRQAVIGAYEQGLLEVDAIGREDALGAGATLEHRIPMELPTGRLPPKRGADDTGEAEIIEVVETRRRPR